MEDGVTHTKVSETLNEKIKEVVTKMANYPDVEVTVIKNKNNTDCVNSDNTLKVNGESDKISNDEQDEYTSDEDALIIDEEIKNEGTKTRKRVRSPSPRANFKGFKKRAIAKSANYFRLTCSYNYASRLSKDRHSGEDCDRNEERTEGELDTETQNKSDEKTVDTLDKPPLENSHKHTEPRHRHVSFTSKSKKSVKKRPSQKLTEYAQYLGLQPAVKFKCVKCSESSFPSLSSLNEHQRQCLSQQASKPTPATSVSAPASSTNFRVTRKVFLCSSCGTYYENCNLFLHMREVHRRYICLYCLGMFSLPEKLSHHLVTKHNCSPNHYASTEDFLSSYKESCFLVCCNCERVFSERDNFFDHVCIEKKSSSEKACWSCGMKGSGTHGTSCKAGNDQPSTSSLAQKPSSKSINKSQKQGKDTSQKQNKDVSQKQNKDVSQKQKSKNSTKNAAPVGHVTGDDSPVEEEEEILDEQEKTPGKEEIPGEPEERQTDGKNPTTNDMDTTETPQTENTEDSEEIPPVETQTSDNDKKEKDQLNNEDLHKGDDECVKNENSENCESKETEDTEDNEEEKENSDNEPENHTNEKSDTSDCENDKNSESEHEENADQNPEKENTDKPTDDDSQENSNSVNETEQNDTATESDGNNTDAESPENSDHNTSNENEIESKNEDGPESDVLQLVTENKQNDSNDSPRTDVEPTEDEKPMEREEENKDDEVTEMDTKVEEEAEKSPETAPEKEPEETRKVPKVTLKLPQGMIYSENESDDSEKLTMEVEENGDSDIEGEAEGEEGEYDESQEEENKITESVTAVNGFNDEDDKRTSDCVQSDDEGFQVAGDDIPIIELQLEQPLDKLPLADLLKTCLTATVPTCVYCNHARRIAVNGKQLGLHAIAEHRYSATVNSITAEELIPESFVRRIKESLDDIESVYFCLEDKPADETSEEPTATIFKRIYECFQCRYVTTIHKELYLHNRKMHAKTILLCIMCKSNFYSYSELICHLCPGNYVLDSETKFRCCMCDANDLPSAFRLMVHLRKRHHTCDVCLEGCNNQSKLSNHVWKHKLHHLCYRCGIAYRNKPDITKHLFWKHGTESVLCKKCLQKKWPHVYHFCIPPISFVCEECNLSFSRAVYLKVHKRLHSSEKPHACTEENCTQTFISKKLLLKHEMRHREPVPEILEPTEEVKDEVKTEADKTDENKEVTETKQDDEKMVGSPEKEEQKPKSIIDVYDLPALNLSESDSDDSSDEAKSTSAPRAEENKTTEETKSLIENLTNIPTTNEKTLEEEQKPVPILDGIWDNFKNYQATIEKRDSLQTDSQVPEKCEEKLEPEEPIPDLNVILSDHDYCTPRKENSEEAEEAEKVKNEESTGMDHDYCTVNKNENGAQNTNELENSEKKKTKSPKKKSKHNGSSSSSDSSSDSDSSSCTCGSNCSCSSSSGSSSSSSSSTDSDSSSSEGKRRIAARRERRKERIKRKKESETSHAASNTSAVDVVATEDILPPCIELPILETDLDTDETETDEDFYDEHPQRLANKILAEKRNQLALLAAVAPVSNGTIIEYSRPSTPSIPEEAPPVKKKVKNKKRKKKSRSSTPKHIPEYRQQTITILSTPTPVIQPSIPSLTLINPGSGSLPDTPKPNLSNTGSGSETDSNVRSSKRRRVPNKFYGYSSDDESSDKPPIVPVLKWRKADLPSTPSHVTGSPQFVPPITIKNIPSPAPVIEPIRAPVSVLQHNEVVDSESDQEEVPRQVVPSDSSESNHEDSDSDNGQLHISQPGPGLVPTLVPNPIHASGVRTNENLYCYCQCPYDEVSEMIACDGKDCAIEWFHFECVGIMVPPKGKWFCPDCRKKATMRNDSFVT